MSHLSDLRVRRILGETGSKSLMGQSVAIETSLCGLRYDSREPFQVLALVGQCSDEELTGQGRASRVRLRRQSFPLLLCSGLDVEAGADFSKWMLAGIRWPGFLLIFQFGCPYP